MNNRTISITKPNRIIMETTRQQYDRLTRMSEELARMQREFIVKMLKENGNRLEIDRDSENYDCEAQLEAETKFGTEMVDVDYLRYDEEGGRIYWGGLYNGEDIYEDELFSFEYDEIMENFIGKFVE